MAHYPADTFQEAVDLSITASNQLHTILNGDSTTEVAVEDGSKIPSVRKAYTDSLFFLSPQPWVVGGYETIYNQLRAFTETNGVVTWWFSKTATVSTPTLMSITPHDDSNWTLWNAINNSVYETQKRLAAEAGLNMVGSFLLGATVTTTIDVVFYETDGKYYGWGGTLPKTVPAGSTPSTSGGIGADAWSDKTDLMLRSDINVVQKRFACVADMVADISLLIGNRVSYVSYHLGIGKGGNSGVVVADGTGTVDGGSYISLSNGLQVKMDLTDGVISPLLFGAKGNFSKGDDQAVLKTIAYQGTSVLDLSDGFLMESSTIHISKPLVVIGDGMYGNGGLAVSHSNTDIFDVIGSSFGANGFQLRDIKITSSCTGIQNLFSPKVPQSWRSFKNVYVSGVLGGIFNHSALVDTYCQRWEVDRLETRNCGQFCTISGDTNTVLPRPFGTFAILKDIAMYDYFGVAGQTSIADLRGWRNITGVGGFEFTTSKTVASSVSSVFDFRSNGKIDLDTIWYEPSVPAGSTNVTRIFSFSEKPTCTVDGYSGAPVKIKTVESSVALTLCYFNTNTDYDVEFDDVGVAMYWRTAIKDSCYFGNLLSNMNSVKINRVKRGAFSDFYIPNSLFGILSVSGVWGTSAGVFNPPLGIESSPILYSWRGTDNILPSAKPAQSIFNVDLSDSSIATKEIVTIDGSLALHVVAASTYPKILYKITIPTEYVGSWVTISIRYKVVNATSGCVPRIIDVDPGSTVNHAYWNDRDVAYGDTAYHSCLCHVQPNTTSLTLKVVYTGTTPTTPLELYIKGIDARFGRMVSTIQDY